MQTAANQGELKLAFGVHHAPKDAPMQIVRQCETEGQALAVSIRAGGHKLAYIAKCVNRSVPYISQLQNGRRPIPDRLVGPLCAATGSNLLRQVRDLHRALEAQDEVARLAEMLRAAA
jgi:hypothetical protein